MPKGVLWNLFLAAIPAVLGYALGWSLSKRGKRRNIPLILCLPLAGAWIAMLPNSCYLLSEWRHFLFNEHWRYLLDASENDHAAMLDVAKWGLVFIGYSGIGVLFFVLAVRPVERVLRANGHNPILHAPAFFFVISLGDYLGLIVRLNSWNVINHPLIVWEAADNALFNPDALIPILIFAAILWVIYEAADLWMDGVKQRLSALSEPK